MPREQYLEVTVYYVSGDIVFDEAFIEMPITGKEFESFLSFYRPYGEVDRVEMKAL